MKVVTTLLLAVTLLLPSCNRQSKPKIAAAVRDSPQAKQAANAVDHLRAIFNTGGCAAIYEQADKAFRARTSKEWEGFCGQLVTQAGGAWNRFQVSTAETCGLRASTVCVIGMAEFDKKTVPVAVAFKLGDEKASLMTFQFYEAGDHWRTYLPFPSLDLWRDPPWKNPRESAS